MPKFEPIRDVLFSMVEKSTNDDILTKYPDLNLDFLKTEEEEVEKTLSETAELGPERKKTSESEVEKEPTPEPESEKCVGQEKEMEKEANIHAAI